MMTIAAGDAELRYEHTVRPGAPALLMLNSLGTSLEMWDDEFAALSERYELIRYDARGHGKSSAGTLRERRSIGWRAMRLPCSTPAASRARTCAGCRSAA